MGSFTRTVRLEANGGLAKIVLVTCVALFILLILPASAVATTRNFPISGTQDYAAAYQMLNLLNAERARVGRPALRMDTAMMNTAMQRAAETTTSFSHTRPNGQHWSTLLPAGNTWWGENLAVGQATAADAMKGLMNSPGHRANIVHDKFTSVGIGVFEHNGSRYWVQIFGNKKANNPARPANKAATYSVAVLRSNARLSLHTQVLSPTSAKYSLRVGTPSAWKPAVVNNSAVLFTSTNTSVANINSSGTLAMGTNPGSVTVRAALKADTGLLASTSYTVHAATFNSNGGSAVPRRLFTPNNSLGTLPTPSRQGHSFIGWFTAANGGTQVWQTTRFTGNVTLFAHWRDAQGLLAPPVQAPAQPVATPAPSSPPAAQATPPKPAAPKPAPQRIDASVKSIRMRPGTTLRIPIVVRGNTNSKVPVTWRSSNGSVATLYRGRSNGSFITKQNERQELAFTALKAGTTQIVLRTENGKQLVFRIDVRRDTRRLQKVSIGNLPPSRSMTRGASRDLSARLTPTNATLSGRVLWSSSNSKIASVDQAGRLRAHKKGSAVITLHVANRTHKATISVR